MWVSNAELCLKSENFLPFIAALALAAVVILRALCSRYSAINEAQNSASDVFLWNGDRSVAVATMLKRMKIKARDSETGCVSDTEICVRRRRSSSSEREEELERNFIRSPLLIPF
jgi:hypothetical protein